MGRDAAWVVDLACTCVESLISNGNRQRMTEGIEDVAPPRRHDRATKMLVGGHRAKMTSFDDLNERKPSSEHTRGAQHERHDDLQATPISALLGDATAVEPNRLGLNHGAPRNWRSE